MKTTPKAKTEVGMDKIRKIAELLKIPEESVCDGLGIPTGLQEQLLEMIQAATTVEQVQYAYEQAQLGSEVERLAIEKWLSFCPTIEEVKGVCRQAPGGVCELALEKWDQLSLKEVEAATTVEQANEAYNHAPSGSNAERSAKKKWGQFSIAGIEAATTIEQVEAIYRQSPGGDEIEKLTIRKMAELIPD